MGGASLRRSFADAASFGAKPSIDAAKAMPKDYSEMKNELLVAIALQGDHGARKERLIREVMLQDGVAHTDALATVDQMSRENKGNNWFWKLPYRVGIFTAVTAGVASFPMVFDLGTALWFNEYFVTADVAEPEDLETPLEVHACVCARGDARQEGGRGGSTVRFDLSCAMLTPMRWMHRWACGHGTGWSLPWARSPSSSSACSGRASRCLTFVSSRESHYTFLPFVDSMPTALAWVILLGCLCVWVRFPRVPRCRYTDSMMNFRAGSLASSYPKYDAEIIKEFALVDMWE